jgi:hypothetical protein
MSDPKSAADQYADIEREAAQIAGQIPDAPPHAKASLAALMQHSHGLTVIEYCLHCEARLTVTALSESAWKVSCPCGRSDNAFRGL